MARSTVKELNIFLEVRRGRGYVPSEENHSETEDVGRIPLDSIYSPVHRVRYAIEATRVGKFTNYDRLVLEIWTDGTVTPEMALVEAAKIYRKHLNPFVLFDSETSGTRSPVDRGTRATSSSTRRTARTTKLQRAADRARSRTSSSPCARATAWTAPTSSRCVTW